MQTSIELIDSAKKKLDISSDYALSIELGVGRSSVSFWRRGISHPSDENALQLADILELDPGYVLACIHADKAEGEVKNVWQKLVKASRVAALSIILYGVMWLTGTLENQPDSVYALGLMSIDNLYIMHIR